MKLFNFKLILSFLGISSILNSFFMLLAVPISFYYNEDIVANLFMASATTFAIGFSLWFFNRNAKKVLKKRDGYLIVTIGWLVLTLTGTLPYLFTGSITGFTNAFFETISGYSTTGASIVDDIEALPKGILFWRSATHWIGGMGIIVLTVAILPLLGIGGMQLFMAEAPGPSADKLHPRITETAKRLWLIYMSLTVVELFMLKIAGMSWFDSINHSMATMSTGGFSTKNASVAFWNDQPAIQYVISLFMFIAGTNFVLTYFAIQGKFAKVFRNEEFKYYLFGFLGIASVLSIIIIYFQDPNLVTTISHPIHYGEVESDVRHAIFQVLSITTTTGFVSADFTMWNPLATLILFSLFFVGGSAGSTSGGIKIVRHIIMIKSSLLEFKKQIHPNAIIPVRYEGRGVQQSIVFNILSFFVIYVLIFVVSSVIFAFMGLDFITALSTAASSLGNIGPALGQLSPVNNYNSLPEIGKWFSSLLMLIGRLELFTVLILFSPFFWKKN